MSPCSVYISKLPDAYLVPLKLLLDRKRKPKPGSLISATHRRGVHFSQDFLLSAFSFPPFFLGSHSLASMGQRIWLRKLCESLNKRWIPGPQTVWTSNSEKIGAEWFGTQSRKLSFPAGRMELTVILRLLKEPCPGVISVLSDNVDI